MPRGASPDGAAAAQWAPTVCRLPTSFIPVKCGRQTVSTGLRLRNVERFPQDPRLWGPHSQPQWGAEPLSLSPTGSQPVYGTRCREGFGAAPGLGRLSEGTPLGAQEKPDALLSLPNSPLPRCSREDGTGTGPVGRAPLLGGPAPRVDVPAVASAGEAAPDCELWPPPGEKPSPLVSAGKPARRGEPWAVPWLLSSAERCPWLWRWGTGPAVPPETLRPQELLQELAVCSPGPGELPAPSLAVRSSMQQTCPEFSHTWCWGPQRAPKAARGQGCPGVLRSGLGQCRGLMEHRGGAQGRAGWGKGPDEEGLKQR